MTFTYSLLDLNTPLAKIRRKIGDTNSADVLIEDEEINQVILERPGSVLDQATEVIRNALAAVARDVDRSNLGMSATRSQKFEQLTSVMDFLMSESGKTAEPFVGGVSRDRKRDLATETDFTQPLVSRGQHSIHDPDHRPRDRSR